jgi:hypothetical protein
VHATGRFGVMSAIFSHADYAKPRPGYVAIEADVRQVRSFRCRRFISDDNKRVNLILIEIWLVGGELIVE